MAIGTVELVLFAIQAGLKLGQAARRAYVEQTRIRAIALPLPTSGVVLDDLNARTFFQEEGSEAVERFPRLAALHTKALQRPDWSPGKRDYDEYMEFYLYEREIYTARMRGADIETSAGATIDPDALDALFRLEQWDREDSSRPKPMRRVLGAVVDVAISYFATVPGALDIETKHQKVLASFIRGIDKMDVEQIAVEEDVLESLVAGLLIAALETVGDYPELVASDVQIQKLVTVSSDALSVDIAQHLATASTVHESEVVQAWGEMVFRSLLRSAGTHIIERPSDFLGVDDEAQQALITSIGGAAIGLVASDSGLDPERLFTRQGLEVLLTAAFETVAEHPELVTDTDSEGIQALISSIAMDLAAVDGIIDRQVLPEVARMVLSRTGEHLPLIWPSLDPDEHLLLTAAKTTLELLTARPPSGAKWKPAFGQQELLTVVDTVLDELAHHPAWLLAAADDIDANLRAALEATLKVLRRRADERLSPAIAAHVLQSAVRAIAVRQEFLDELPRGRVVVGAAIDAVFTEVFAVPKDSAAAWVVLRDEAIAAIADTVLDALAATDLSKDTIGDLEDTIADAMQRLVDGETLDFESLLADIESGVLPITPEELP